jgi:hypothetical protein
LFLPWLFLPWLFFRWSRLPILRVGLSVLTHYLVSHAFLLDLVAFLGHFPVGRAFHSCFIPLSLFVYLLVAPSSSDE